MVDYREGFVEWDGLAEKWVETYDSDFPDQPYVQKDQSVADFITGDVFNLPGGGSIGGSNLPGYDIRNQDAYSMIQLSLAAESLLNNKLVECYADNSGNVSAFSIGGPGANLDVWYEIETFTLQKRVDSVLVQGYDPPAQRVAKGPFNLLTFANDSPIEDVDTYPLYWSWATAGMPVEGCEYYKEAYIEYGDPNFDNNAVLIEQGIVDKSQFESLSFYIYRIEVPFFKQDSTTVKFAATTTRFYELDGFGKLQNRTWQTADRFYVSEYCKEEEGQVAQEGTGVILPRSDDDKFISVKDVFIYGYKINQIIPDFYRRGDNREETGAVFQIVIDTQLKEPFRLTRGEDYIIDKGEAGLKIVFSCNVHPNYLDNFGGYMSNGSAKVRISPASIFENVATGKRASFKDIYDPDNKSSGKLKDGVTPADTINQFDVTIFPIGDGRSGYVVDKIIVLYDWNNPCIAIYDNDNQGTMPNLEGVTAVFTAMVSVDRPAPTAVNGEVLDPSDVVPDAYADTNQELHNTRWARALASQEPGDIKLSLPFLDESGCVSVSSYIKYLAANTSDKSLSVICGPESKPVLGASYNGGVINAITYNYQDSSQYTISVTTGPQWLGSSSWENAVYRNTTERLTMDGMVLFVDGVNQTCSVKLEQLGVVEAINNSRDILEAGDRVTVQIYNNPVAY